MHSQPLHYTVANYKVSFELDARGEYAVIKALVNKGTRLVLESARAKVYSLLLALDFQLFTVYCLLSALYPLFTISFSGLQFLV
jgi:hypothetical protein